MSLVDAPGKEAYPISGLTWLLIYKDQKDQAKGKALVSFLKWAMNEGQKIAPSLLYAPLPKPVVEKVNKAIGQIK